MSRTVRKVYVPFLAALALVWAALSVSADTQPTGTWKLLGSLLETRDGAAAALLPDGGVLIAGGRNSAGILATAERFDVNSGSVALALMTTARANATATTLKDGRVLVTGGSVAGALAADGSAGPDGATATAEIFDALAGTWTPVAMSEARTHHTASLLPDGRVLVVGGDNGGASPVPSATAEVFDPTQNQFFLAGVLATARTRHATAVLQDGIVLIAGGETADATSHQAQALASTELLDPISGTSTPGPAMSLARENFTATSLLNGDVLVAGGTDGTSETASAERFVSASGAFVSVGGLQGSRQGHVALRLPDNNGVLVAGGTASGVAVTSTELFLPTSGLFVLTGETAVGHVAAVTSGTAVEGRAVVAGGRGTAAAEQYRYATVRTDKDDYAPGTTVTITGTGWVPGETVFLSMVEYPLLDTHPLLPVVADADGNIVSTEFVPDVHDLNVRFYLTATGSQGEAVTTFTDASNVTAATVAVQDATCTNGQLTFSGGDTVCARVSVTGTTGSGGGSFFIVWENPSSSVVRTTTQAVPSSVPTAFTDTLATVATDPGGTWTVKVCKTTGCSGGNLIASTTFALTAGTTLTVTTASGTYGGSTGPITATLTKTVGGTGISGKTITFLLNGGVVGTAGPTNGSGVATLASASLTSPAVIAAATYTSGVRASFAGDSGFGASSGTNTLTVSKAHLTVTADPQSKPYDGHAFSPFTATIAGFVNSENSSVVSGAASFGGAATTAVNAGSYTITPAQGTLTATNYDFTTFNNGTLTISQVHLTVKADNQAKPYDGAVFSPFTATITGFVNGENSSVVSGAAAFSGAATTAVNAGSYTITPAQGTLSATNYDFTTFNNGTLTISKVHLTVTADAKSKMYDGAVFSAFTATLSGFVNSETSAVVSGAAGFTGAATTAINAGSYAITPTAGTLAATNYDFTSFISGILTIAQAPQAIVITTHAPGTATFGTNFTVGANGGGSGNAVVFANTVGGGCSNVGSNFSMTSGVAVCVVHYNQAGNSNYLAAPELTETVTPIGFAFQGFYAPIDMSTLTATVWNKANAGQAIPTKWRLTLNGIAVSALSSFTDLYSFQVNCSTGAGDITNSVEEYAAGNSSLIYKGDGNFQFDWKTPKAYAGTCRKMYVKFSDGSMTTLANFIFK